MYRGTVVRGPSRRYFIYIYRRCFGDKHLRPRNLRPLVRLLRSTYLTLPAITVPFLGAERTAVERFHEGVGRGAQGSEEYQHPVDILARYGGRRHCYCRRGVVMPYFHRRCIVSRGTPRGLWLQGCGGSGSV